MKKIATIGVAAALTMAVFTPFTTNNVNASAGGDWGVYYAPTLEELDGYIANHEKTIADASAAAKEGAATLKAYYAILRQTGTYDINSLEEKGSRAFALVDTVLDYAEAAGVQVDDPSDLTEAQIEAALTTIKAETVTDAERALVNSFNDDAVDGTAFATILNDYNTTNGTSLENSDVADLAEKVEMIDLFANATASDIAAAIELAEYLDEQGSVIADYMTLAQDTEAMDLARAVYDAETALPYLRAQREAEAAYDYSVLNGGDQTYVAGNGITIRFNGNYWLFESLYINDQLIDAENYTVEEGSTIITLKSDYLATLASGEYTVAAHYRGGKVATSKFYIADTTPNTGVMTASDESAGGATEANLASLPLAAATVLAAGATVIIRRRLNQ